MRAPRWKRSAVRPFRITGRDVSLIKAVHVHRLADSEHLARLVGDSAQNIRRRLQLLFHAGYLDRPLAQRLIPATGSRPMLYALANKGAKLLHNRGVNVPLSVWNSKNRRLHPGFMQNTILVSSTMIDIEVSCRENPNRVFVPWAELLSRAPERTRCEKRPHQWSVGTEHGRLPVVPDAIFGIRHLDLPPNRRDKFYCLEAHRGTEPYRRKDFRQSSLEKKLVAYEAMLAQKLHTKRFGWGNFRVVVVGNVH